MRFIRKNGRIIPIADKGSVKAAKAPVNAKTALKPAKTEKARPGIEAAKGTAFVVAGLGSSYLAGRARRVGGAQMAKLTKMGLAKLVKSKKLAKDLGKGAQLAFDFTQSSQGLAMEAAAHFKKARQTLGIARAFNHTARLGGIGLTAAGATRIYDAVSPEKNTAKRNRRAAVVGAAVGLAGAGTAQAVGLFGKKHLSKILVHNFRRMKKML